MIHYSTPNGQWLTNYGYQKLVRIAEIEISGQT
jgi:hypothetical protein